MDLRFIFSFKTHDFITFFGNKSVKLLYIFIRGFRLMFSLYTINGISFDNSKMLNICDKFINLPAGFESY